MLAVAAFGFVACSDDDTQATTIDVVRSDIGFEAEGGNGAIEIRVSGDCNYCDQDVKVTTNKDWITIGETNQRMVNFSVAPSTESLNRSGKIFIKAGAIEQEVTILQKGTYFDIEVKSYELDPAGLVATTIEYVSNSGSTPEVIIPENASWVSAKVENGVIELIGTLNYEQPRTAKITVKMDWKPVEITLSQGAVNLVTMEAISTVKASAYEVTITPTEYLPLAAPAWDVKSNNDWITVEKAADSFTVKLSENTTGKTRNGSISLTDGGTKVLRTITVEQGIVGPGLFVGSWAMPCQGFNDAGQSADVVYDVTISQSSGNTYIFNANALPLKATYVETADDAYMIIEPQLLGRAGSYYLFALLRSDNGYTLNQVVSGYGIKLVYKDSTTLEVKPYNNPGWPNGGYTNGIYISACTSNNPQTSAGPWDKFLNLTTLTRK